jgi:uncharacterized protein DUF1573
MNKVILSICCLLLSAGAVNAQSGNTPAATQTTMLPEQSRATTPQPAAPAPDPNAGEFKFKEETHDYGEVPEGPLAGCDFEFKNTGKSPIIITEAHGSCGCTVPSWPHEPIKPGGKGVIHVDYNTQGRQGMIMKDVIITSNAKQTPMVLHIRGTVKPKPVDPPAVPAGK